MRATHATPTAVGDIAHARLRVANGLEIEAPIKLVIEPEHCEAGVTCEDLPLPLVRSGRLVYALPGGGEIEVELSA